jgi:hypothetical protein
MYSVQNGTMRSLKLFQEAGDGVKEKDRDVNLTKMYCKHFYNCHNVPPVQLKYAINKRKII